MTALIRVVALLLAVAFVPMFAGQISYLDRSLWEAEVSIIDTVTFIGPEPGTSVNYNNSSGLLYNGIRFVGDLGPGTYWLAAVNAGTSQTWYNWGSGGILRDYDQDTATQKRIRVTLPADVTAFGVDLMTGGTNALPVTIRVTDIDGLVTTYGRDTYARPTHAFFGVTSDRAISVAEFWTTTTSTYVFMDDFTTATLNPESSTPDPQTWLLAATGLVLVAFRRVRYGRP